MAHLNLRTVKFLYPGGKKNALFKIGEPAYNINQIKITPEKK
jgi:hypothetical protein